MTSSLATRESNELLASLRELTFAFVSRVEVDDSMDYGHGLGGGGGGGGGGAPRYTVYARTADRTMNATVSARSEDRGSFGLHIGPAHMPDTHQVSEASPGEDEYDRIPKPGDVVVGRSEKVTSRKRAAIAVRGHTGGNFHNVHETRTYLRKWSAGAEPLLFLRSLLAGTIPTSKPINVRSALRGHLGFDDLFVVYRVLAEHKLDDVLPLRERPDRLPSDTLRLSHSANPLGFVLALCDELGARTLFPRVLRRVRELLKNDTFEYKGRPMRVSECPSRSLTWSTWGLWNSEKVPHRLARDVAPTNRSNTLSVFHGSTRETVKRARVAADIHMSETGFSRNLGEDGPADLDRVGPIIMGPIVSSETPDDAQAHAGQRDFASMLDEAQGQERFKDTVEQERAGSRSPSPAYHPASACEEGSTSPVYRPSSPFGGPEPMAVGSTSPVYRPTSPDGSIPELDLFPETPAPIVSPTSSEPADPADPAPDPNRVQESVQETSPAPASAGEPEWSEPDDCPKRAPPHSPIALTHEAPAMPDRARMTTVEEAKKADAIVWFAGGIGASIDETARRLLRTSSMEREAKFAFAPGKSRTNMRIILRLARHSRCSVPFIEVCVQYANRHSKLNLLFSTPDVREEDLQEVPCPDIGHGVTLHVIKAKVFAAEEPVRGCGRLVDAAFYAKQDAMRAPLWVTPADMVPFYSTALGSSPPGFMGIPFGHETRHFMYKAMPMIYRMSERLGACMPLVAYHGTTSESAAAICKDGWALRDGVTRKSKHRKQPLMFGDGVYLGDMRKAARFACAHTKQAKISDDAGVILRVLLFPRRPVVIFSGCPGGDATLRHPYLVDQAKNPKQADYVKWCREFCDYDALWRDRGEVGFCAPHGKFLKTPEMVATSDVAAVTHVGIVDTEALPSRPSAPSFASYRVVAERAQAPKVIRHESSLWDHIQ